MTLRYCGHQTGWVSWKITGRLELRPKTSVVIVLRRLFVDGKFGLFIHMLIRTTVTYSYVFQYTLATVPSRRYRSLAGYGTVKNLM